MQISGVPVAPGGQGLAPRHPYSVLRHHHRSRDASVRTLGTLGISYMLLGLKNSGGFGQAGISPG
jgi:hypothetical protein